MAHLNGFNANEVDPNVPFEVRPAGDYLVHMVASKMKPTKNGNGSFLECEFEVIDGEFKGAKFWDRLNLNNPNPETVKIARGTLSAICRCVGVMKPSDSCELHNLPLIACVRIKKREDNGELVNEIKGYKKKASTLTQQPATANQKTASNTAPPWQS